MRRLSATLNNFPSQSPGRRVIQRVDRVARCNGHCGAVRGTLSAPFFTLQHSPTEAFRRSLAIRRNALQAPNATSPRDLAEFGLAREAAILMAPPLRLPQVLTDFGPDADEVIGRINMLNDVQHDRPFMVCCVPGATHAPPQPTKEWVDRIRAMHLFDDGYEAVREWIYANQKKLCAIPRDANLTV